MKIDKITSALLIVVVLALLVSALMLSEISNQDRGLREELRNINLTKEQLRGEISQMRVELEGLNQSQQVQDSKLAEAIRQLQNAQTTTTTAPVASSTTTTLKPTTTQQTTTTLKPTTTTRTTTTTRRTTTTTRVTRAS